MKSNLYIGALQECSYYNVA